MEWHQPVPRLGWHCVAVVRTPNGKQFSIDALRHGNAVRGKYQLDDEFDSGLPCCFEHVCPIEIGIAKSHSLLNDADCFYVPSLTADERSIRVHKPKSVFDRCSLPQRSAILED